MLVSSDKSIQGIKLFNKTPFVLGRNPESGIKSTGISRQHGKQPERIYTL